MVLLSRRENTKIRKSEQATSCHSQESVRLFVVMKAAKYTCPETRVKKQYHVNRTDALMHYFRYETIAMKSLVPFGRKLLNAGDIT